MSIVSCVQVGILLEKAKAGLVELFFMDASHFVMGEVPGRLWGKVRQWVRTASGRKRYNVLGALNFISKKIETVTNDSYITSTQVVEMLENIASKYVGKPIYLILDNARYQKCAFVIETFDVYCNTISNFVNSVEVIHCDKRATLVTDKFQTFGKCKIL